MSIRVLCASCKTEHTLLPTMAGKKVRCKCGAVLTVPQPQASNQNPQNPAAQNPAVVDPLAVGGNSTANPAAQNPAAQNPAAQNPAAQNPAVVDPLAVGGNSTANTGNYYGAIIPPVLAKAGLPGWVIPAGIGGVCFTVVVAIVLIVLPLFSGDDNPATDNAASEAGLDSTLASGADGDREPSGNSNPNEVVNGIGMRLARVGGLGKGAQKVGSVLPKKEIANDKNNNPQGTITADESPQYHLLYGDFMVGVHEVTQAQYREVMEDNPSTIPGDNLPVHNVSWFQAQEFCQRLNKLATEKDAQRVYRLPTEAEWEYVCRGDTNGRYYFGETNDELTAHAWYRDNSEGTLHPVGSKEMNPAGTHDMLGNVWEWCHDWYGVASYSLASGKENPKGPDTGIVRVIRGGSSWNHAKHTRDGFRFYAQPQEVHERIGFRVVCHLKGPPASVPKLPSQQSSSGFQDLQEFSRALFTQRFPTAAIADRRDLTQLPLKVFDGGRLDRPEIIKSAALFYKKLPSNVDHTTKNIGAAGSFKEAFAVEKVTTGGLRYADGLAINMHQDGGTTKVFFIGPITKFKNGWKLTGRFDYVNQSSFNEAMFPIEELKAEKVVLPGENNDYGLGYQRGEPICKLPLVGVKVAAVPFHICLSPDHRHLAAVYAHEEVIAGLQKFTGKAEVAVWRLEDRSIVFQKDWTNTSIGGNVAHAEFTPDSKKLYYGKSRLFVVDLDTYQEASESIRAPSRENEWLLHPETGEPVFVPDGLVSESKARFHKNGNIYSLHAYSVSVYGPNGNQKTLPDFSVEPLGTFGVTENGIVFGYRPTPDPRDGEVVDASGRMILPAGWQATGPRNEDIRQIAGHDNVFHTTISPDASRIYYNERVGSRDILKIWHITRGRSLFTLQYQLNTLDTGHVNPPYYSHDGQFLMLVVDRSIFIWKLSDGFSG